MTNLEIARIFSEIADILEIREENPFKVRAYRRVTQLLESLPQEVEEIYKRGELHNLPGVGASIAEKIKEIIETGKLKYHEELKKNIPSGLLEMLRIPEMGPKTVALVYKKLGISTIEELEKAAREKKLRNLYGLGPKTEENIIKGMSLIKKRKERIPLHEALVLAEDIIKRLKESGKVKRITYCGSVRRRKETIGDIDILATSSDPSQVMEVFTSLPLVKEVVAKGHTKSSILVGEGRQVDLRVVEEESFGAALHYFTGSKSHNIRVRELGVRKGLKINEYGVFVRKKEKDERIGGREEEEVFTYVDLPYIPPELREDWGEIEAAQKGRLPKLIELKEIKGDTHVHTRWSDGANTVREVVIAAREKGYEYIGICDHSQSLKVAGGVSKENFFQSIEEIRKIDQEITEVKVLAGAEVDILPDGSLDYPDELLRELDIVIASVHSKFKQDEDSMTRRIMKAMENPFVDIIGHPTGRLLGEREAYKVNMEKLLKYAVQTGTAMEINAYPERMDLKDTHVRMAKDMGVKLVIGTDAHHLLQLDWIKYGVWVARRGWLESKDVLNTLPFQEFFTLLKKRS